MNKKIEHLKLILKIVHAERSLDGDRDKLLSQVQAFKPINENELNSLLEEGYQLINEPSIIYDILNGIEYVEDSELLFEAFCNLKDKKNIGKHTYSVTYENEMGYGFTRWYLLADNPDHAISQVKEIAQKEGIKLWKLQKIIKLIAPIQKKIENIELIAIVVCHKEPIFEFLPRSPYL